MTAAKISRAPAEGHGLTDRITEPHFDQLVKGQPRDMVAALVLFKPEGFGGSEKQGGATREVVYELARVEPITDPNDRDDAMWKIQSLYESRTSTGTQRQLPLALPNEERKQALLERIDDWATEKGLTGGELEAKWRDSFCIGPDQDWSMGDSGVPGDYRRASVNYLLQFLIEIGAEQAEAGGPGEGLDGDGDAGDEPKPDDE